MDLTSMSAALSSLVAAKDITQSMVGLRDTAAFQEKRLELQSKIMDAQASVFSVNEERTTLIDRVSTLEKEIADLKAWDAEKNRYELKRLDTGGFAYTLKAGSNSSEPEHFICATCYQRGKKSILQPEMRMPGRASVLACFECGADIYLTGLRPTNHAPYSR
jgi:hypothetical protein